MLAISTFSWCPTELGKILKGKGELLSTIPVKSVSFSKFTEHFHRRSGLVFVFPSWNANT